MLVFPEASSQISFGESLLSSSWQSWSTRDALGTSLDAVSTFGLLLVTLYLALLA
jgi:hypothetical protein